MLSAEIIQILWVPKIYFNFPPISPQNSGFSPNLAFWTEILRQKICFDNFSTAQNFEWALHASCLLCHLT